MVCIYFISSMKISIKHPLVSSVPALPSLTPLSTNYEKLCYLTAWQSLQASNARLMKFSSECAIYIDSGSSCCISNNKADFLTFAPSSSTILQGISIVASKSLALEHLNGQFSMMKVMKSLFISTTVCMFQIPQCVFSAPQHMAQQTTSTSDGFHSKGKCRILTFSGFTQTIYYKGITPI
jgi:hypothetical protein